MKKFTTDLIDEIIDTYENVKPMRISMILRGKCYICENEDKTPLDIDVTYEITHSENANMHHNRGWIHCKSCKKYIDLYNYYRSPYSVYKITDKYNGMRVKFSRVIPENLRYKYNEKCVGYQDAYLGYKNFQASIFTMFNDREIQPWNGMTRIMYTPHVGSHRRRKMPHCVVYALVHWNRRVDGDYGYKHRSSNNRDCQKLIPLRHLILFNRNIFGYSLEESKIIPGTSPNWKKRLRVEYEYANKASLKWDIFRWCLNKSDIKSPCEVIMKKIFEMWFNERDLCPLSYLF